MGTGLRKHDFIFQFVNPCTVDIKYTFQKFPKVSHMTLFFLRLFVFFGFSFGSWPSCFAVCCTKCGWFICYECTVSYPHYHGMQNCVFSSNFIVFITLYQISAQVFSHLWHWEIQILYFESSKIRPLQC